MMRLAESHRLEMITHLLSVMIRLLRKDTVCIDVTCQCGISEFAWNFGHEWLKGDGDRSLSTWHDMLTAVVPVASPSCNLERSFSTQRRRDATEIVFAADCERRHTCASIRDLAAFIRVLAKNYHEPIIFSKINKRGDTYKKRNQGLASKNLYTLRRSLAICRRD